MVIRCNNEVSGTDQLRSQDGEGGGCDRSGVQPVQVTVGQDGGGYRYPGEVITVYIGSKIVYCGDCVNDAVERICEPGGIEYGLWTL